MNDKSSPEGLQIKSFTSYYGLTQVINEPIFYQSLSRNLVTHSGVHSSFHKICHHQITFVKFDLNVKCLPSYERLVWNYKQANTLFIQNTINESNWENAFSNIKTNKKENLGFLMFSGGIEM